MTYLVRWVDVQSNLVSEEDVEVLNLGEFITGLTNDGHVIVQVEPN